MQNTFIEIQESEPMAGFHLKVVDNDEQLIGHEIARVKYYLDQLDIYRSKGVGGNLRFPDGGGDSLSSGEINLPDLIRKEYFANKTRYSEFCTTLKEAAGKMISLVPMVSTLYGFSIEGDYEIAPTAYGTIGSSASYGSSGPMVFRLPHLRGENVGNFFTTGIYRTPIEFLVHEILAHTVTAPLRAKTPIDESVENATHRWHKEYLMDLLGRTILTESQLMKAEDVAVQKMGVKGAKDDIDPLFYTNSGELSWRGNLKGLIDRVTSSLKDKVS